IEPSENFDEMPTTHPRLTKVDDGRAAIVVEVARCERLIGAIEYTRSGSGSGSTQNLDHVFARHALINHHRQVDRRNVYGRHTHRLSFEATAQLRQDTFDAARETGVDWNDRMKCAARFTQISVVISIDYRLIIHRRMDG